MRCVHLTKAGTLFSRSLFHVRRSVRFVKKRTLGKKRSHDSQVTVGRRDDRHKRRPGSSLQLLFLMRTPANNSGPKPVSRGNNSPRPLHQPPLQVPKGRRPPTACRVSSKPWPARLDQLQALTTSLPRLLLPQLLRCSLWKFKLPQLTLCSYSTFRGPTNL